MSTPGNHQGDGGGESEQSVIKIDPDGDLTLVVGKTKTRFLVCSKTLSRSAPFWKRCLYGQFKEGKPTTGEDWVVDFPEDNPSGLKCLLLLVHGLGHKMPTIDLQLAFEITVITNKYDMTRCLWAVAPSWLDDLEPTRPDEGGDDTIVPQLQWLWITKELGDADRHKENFPELSQMVATTHDGHTHLLLLKPYKPSDADALTRDALGGYDSEKDIILLLTDEIKTARETALSQIQRVLKRDMKDLRDAIRNFDSSNSQGAYICSHGNSSRSRLCEYAMQAIVTKMSARKDSAVKAIAKIDISVEEFLTSAVCFKSRIEREIGLVSGVLHAECTPFEEELPSLENLKNSTLWRWDLANAQAFQKQARVSGLAKDGGDDDDEDQNSGGSLSAACKRSRDEFEAAASE